MSGTGNTPYVEESWIKGASVLVAGAGRFIGRHIVGALLQNGAKHVRAVDTKPRELWYQQYAGAESVVSDLRSVEACVEAVHNVSYVINLAADMGGMGYIETHRVACMRSLLINTHLLDASEHAGAEGYFFSPPMCREWACSAIRRRTSGPSRWASWSPPPVPGIVPGDMTRRSTVSRPQPDHAMLADQAPCGVGVGSRRTLRLPLGQG